MIMIRGNLRFDLVCLSPDLPEVHSQLGAPKTHFQGDKFLNDLHVLSGFTADGKGE